MIKRAGMKSDGQRSPGGSSVLRKRTECSDAEIKYRALFEQSPYGILLIDTAGKILEFNEAAHLRLGYSREEFAKLSLSDIDPVESPQEIQARIKKVLSEGKAEFEVTHRTKQGERRHVHVITQKLVLSGRTVFHTIWRDITETKKYGDALRKANTKLEALIQTIPDMVILKDAEGRYVMVNRALEECTGLKNVDLIGKTDNELLPADIAGMCNRSDAEAIGKRRPIHADERFFDKDGAERFIDTIKAPLYDGNGKLAGLLCVARDITGRKRAEEALQHSEEKFRTLFESATDAIEIIDMQGNFIDVNRTAYERLGYTKEELLSMHLSRLDHPDFAEKIPERMEHLKKHGWCVCESAHLRKDGTYMPVEINARIMNLNGKQVFLSTVRDITERKNAEETIRKFADVIQRIRIGIGIGNADSNTLGLMNPAFAEMHGYTIEELHGRPIADVYAPGVRADLPEYIRMTNEKGYHAFESLHLRKDGSVFPVHVEAYAVRDSSGRTLYRVANVLDITERKKTEEALRNSREFVRSVLDTVDEAFIVIDRNYRAVMVNKAYCAQVNMPVGDIIGRCCYEISHRRTIPCFEAGGECAVRHAFEKEEPHTCIHKHHNRDGSVIYVETKSYPLRDASGKVTSAIEVINNITDRHLLEEQLLRTQKLEAVSLLAGGIAHDFNNLLQSVFGNISLAKLSGDREGQTRELLGEAEKALNQARNLTKQLLTFSKGGEPVKRTIALPSVIRTAVKFALSGSDIDYSFALEEDLLPVDADEGQISQVLHNLVLNASDAMPNGGAIKIRAANVSVDEKSRLPLKKGKYVLIDIEDSGIGIPESHISRIFDPYFTTKQKGSGLGLATSYSIIKKHEGAIDVESQLGEGSTFFIYLPASPGRPAAGETREKRSLRGRGRILLMDDEDLVRMVAARMIESLGYEVDCVESGEEAFEEYSSALKNGTPYDAVILDLTVRGGMGGRETIKRMSELGRPVRAIVSSGFSEDAILSNYRDYGFTATLPKPYKVEELSDILGNVLSPEDGR